MPRTGSHTFLDFQNAMFSFPHLISFDAPPASAGTTTNNNNGSNSNAFAPKFSTIGQPLMGNGTGGPMMSLMSGASSNNSSRPTTPNQFMQQQQRQQQLFSGSSHLGQQAQPQTTMMSAVAPPPFDSFATNLMKATATANNGPQPLQAHAPNSFPAAAQQHQFAPPPQKLSYTAMNQQMQHQQQQYTDTASMLSATNKNIAELEGEERALEMEEQSLRRQLDGVISQNRAVDQQLLELQQAWHGLYELRFRVASQPAFDISAEIHAAEQRLQMDGAQLAGVRSHYESAQQELISLAAVERQLNECETQLGELESGTQTVMQQRRELIARAGRVADVEGQREQALQRVATILDTTAAPQQQQNRSRVASMKRRSQSKNNINVAAQGRNNNVNNVNNQDDELSDATQLGVYGQQQQGDDEDDERSEVFDPSSSSGVFLEQDVSSIAHQPRGSNVSSTAMQRAVNYSGAANKSATRFDAAMDEASHILSTSNGGNSNLGAPTGTKARRGESNNGAAAASKN
jgi:hypothetical protein